MPSGGVPVAPVGGPSGRGSLTAAGVVVVALAIAILKPWAGGSGSDLVGPAPAPSVAAAAPATPAPQTGPGGSPGASGPDPACPLESAWRLFTIETNSGSRVATWYSLDPVHATGPADATIPTIGVYTEALERLGYCAAPRGPGSRASLGEDAWRVAAGGPAERIPLDPANEPGLDEQGRGALFYPPPSADGLVPDTWPPGRYVFVVRRGTTPEDDLWFAARVVAVILPPGADSPPPAPSPGPSSPAPSP